MPKKKVAEAKVPVLELSPKALETYRANMVCVLELSSDSNVELGQKFEVSIGDGEFDRSYAIVTSMQDEESHPESLRRLAVLKLIEILF